MVINKELYLKLCSGAQLGFWNRRIINSWCTFGVRWGALKENPKIKEPSAINRPALVVAKVTSQGSLGSANTTAMNRGFGRQAVRPQGSVMFAFYRVLLVW